MRRPDKATLAMALRAVSGTGHRPVATTSQRPFGLSAASIAVCSTIHRLSRFFLVIAAEICFELQLRELLRIWSQWNPLFPQCSRKALLNSSSKECTCSTANSHAKTEAKEIKIT